jgi:hypothetical protein
MTSCGCHHECDFALWPCICASYLHCKLSSWCDFLCNKLSCFVVDAVDTLTSIYLLWNFLKNCSVLPLSDSKELINQLIINHWPYTSNQGNMNVEWMLKCSWKLAMNVGTNVEVQVWTLTSLLPSVYPASWLPPTNDLMHQYKYERNTAY